MNWPLLIFELIIVIIFLDVIFYGFTTLIFKWGKPYRKLLNRDILIEDKGLPWSYTTWGGTIVQAAILTKGHLILKQNYLTSVENIDVNDIVHFEIKDKLLHKKCKKLVFHIKQSGAMRKFKFTTNKFVEWESILNRQNIKQLGT